MGPDHHRGNHHDDDDECQDADDPPGWTRRREGLEPFGAGAEELTRGSAGEPGSEVSSVQALPFQ